MEFLIYAKRIQKNHTADLKCTRARKCLSRPTLAAFLLRARKLAPSLSLSLQLLYPILCSLENSSQCACASEEQQKKHLLALPGSMSCTSTQIHTTSHLLFVKRQVTSTPSSDEEFREREGARRRNR